jgi:Skp family chaperone for outer membrane proteins
MNRRYALAAATIAALAVGFFSGASVSPGTAKPAEERKPDGGDRPNVAPAHKTAVFNMAAVMRDFGQAKYQVWLLNNKKAELSRNLVVWRGEYVEHQQALQKNPNHPDKEEKAERMLTLARMIEDADRKINKQLNDDASAIIADLYDKMKAVVDEIADRHGFQLVLSYPDAVTPEELKSPYIKELKLKPPAAQPFHVAPEIDITARVVKALNEKYPPLDPKTKEPVDVTRLPEIAAPSAPSTPPAPVPLPPIPGASGTLPVPMPTPKGGLPPIPMPKER